MSGHRQEVPSLLERVATTMSVAIGRAREDLAGAERTGPAGDHRAAADVAVIAAISR